MVIRISTIGSASDDSGLVQPDVPACRNLRVYTEKGT